MRLIGIDNEIGYPLYEAWVFTDDEDVKAISFCPKNTKVFCDKVVSWSELPDSFPTERLMVVK
jgi:hypothetical protein